MAWKANEKNFEYNFCIYFQKEFLLAYIIVKMLVKMVVTGRETEECGGCDKNSYAKSVSFCFVILVEYCHQAGLNRFV